VWQCIEQIDKAPECDSDTGETTEEECAGASAADQVKQ